MFVWFAAASCFLFGCVRGAGSGSSRSFWSFRVFPQLLQLFLIILTNAKELSRIYWILFALAAADIPAAFFKIKHIALILWNMMHTKFPFSSKHKPTILCRVRVSFQIPLRFHFLGSYGTYSTWWFYWIGQSASIWLKYYAMLAKHKQLHCEEKQIRKKKNTLRRWNCESQFIYFPPASVWLSRCSRDESNWPEPGQPSNGFWFHRRLRNSGMVEFKKHLSEFYWLDSFSSPVEKSSSLRCFIKPNELHRHIWLFLLTWLNVRCSVLPFLCVPLPKTLHSPPASNHLNSGEVSKYHLWKRQAPAALTR